MLKFFVCLITIILLLKGVISIFTVSGVFQNLSIGKLVPQWSTLKRAVLKIATPKWLWQKGILSLHECHMQPIFTSNKTLFANRIIAW